jgi:hypothetical protein
MCTARTGSTCKYASALPAIAENAKPAMLDTSADSMMAAAVAAASHPPSVPPTIEAAMRADSRIIHTATDASASRASDVLRNGRGCPATAGGVASLASPAATVATRNLNG